MVYGFPFCAFTLSFSPGLEESFYSPKIRLCGKGK